jgi:hypothetical protein
MTQITPENLLAAGYREYPGLGHETKFFQKKFNDTRGVIYFINISETIIFIPEEKYLYTTKVCYDTNTGGYVWISLTEDTLELSEARAYELWKACGSIYYEEYV